MGDCGCDNNVAIPQGTVYPNGVQPGTADRFVQSTLHVPGSLFRSSPGFHTVRPGRHRLQAAYKGHGIWFTPHRFAEDVGQGNSPLMVEADAYHHADVAELPGSERLDDEGKTTAQKDRMYVAQDDNMPAATHDSSVAENHRHTIDLDGVRTIPGEVTRYGRGLLLNPVSFLSGEYKRTPVKAIVLAGAIVTAVYVVSRDLERSYNRRKRRAGLAAAPAAAVETTGTTAAKVIETPAKVVEEVAEAVTEGAEAVADGITGTTNTVADAAA